MQCENRFIPVNEWNDFYPWPTQGSIRVRICDAEKGRGDVSFLDCIVRIGRRVLIDENKFVEWVRRHGIRDGEHIRDAAYPDIDGDRVSS